MPSDFETGFLVASPSLLDPNFKKSVVLLTAHKPEGALGFVVNRSAGMSFRDVVTKLGLRDEEDEIPNVPVLAGGPVAPETGWLVYDPTLSAAAPEDGVLTVSDRLHVSTSRDLLETVAENAAVTRHLLVLGYAGWAAGQLEGEIRQGVWIPVDLDERIVFETPLEQRWNAALATAGIDPMRIVGMPMADA